MAFKEIQPTASTPDSPEKLLLDLPRRKIPGALPHQEEVMKAYVKEALNSSDVALQLPTGSGKTLVGVMIGEWRRRKYGERIVYLVPNKQLVNQVVEQAEEYGVTVLGFTGPNRDYDATSKAAYKSGGHIAVTSYSSLFNTNPFFDDADVIILDDVHASEGFISGMWSVCVDRHNPKHAILHKALSGLLKPSLDPFNYTRLVGETESITDKTWVDKLPTLEFVSLRNQIGEIFDTYSKDADLGYQWSLIRDHLDACHLYLSSNEILIRPLIPPTWTHPAFTKPKQRIYMSATLGEGGDLERLVGKASIQRLPISEGLDHHGVGRRFFIFPDMSLSKEEVRTLRLELMKQAGRSLVLVPNNRVRDEVIEESRTAGFNVFSPEDIEKSKTPFVSTANAVAVVANRYDGIDFPANDCRLLFVEGLPRAMNAQERFLMSRMGANALFNERIQTRVLQAIGRCTRSLEDYSAVVISGEELPEYLTDARRRGYFHTGLQAELLFGIEQSKGVSPESFVDNLRIFLENGSDWEKVNQGIVNSRKDMKQLPFPAMSELSAAVSDEITYQMKIWQKDYESALRSADNVLSKIKAPELRGYRALWHYLAGSASWLAVEAGGSTTLKARAQSEFSLAKDSATGISWLVSLARYSSTPENKEEAETAVILEQIERIETVLLNLGNTYQRSYAIREKEILEGLASKNSVLFEKAHKLLGELLGFESGNQETEGAPDPWWISSKICLVFEDHNEAGDNAELDIKKARQVASHPAWIRANVPAASGADILPVLITPVTEIKDTVMVHLENVSIWRLKDFIEWAHIALGVVRELRTSFSEPGNLVWRTEAVEILKKHQLDAVILFKKLKNQRPTKST